MFINQESKSSGLDFLQSKSKDVFKLAISVTVALLVPFGECQPHMALVWLDCSMNATKPTEQS